MTLPLTLIIAGLVNLVLARFLVGPLRKKGNVLREKWRSVPVKILSSRIVEAEGEDGPLYSADVRYEYAVDGVRYESDRISLFPKWSSGVRERSEKLIAEFPTGRECSGWVHPAKASEAVLKLEALPPPAWMWVLVTLVGTGIFLILGGTAAWIFG